MSALTKAEILMSIAFLKKGIDSENEHESDCNNNNNEFLLLLPVFFLSWKTTTKLKPLKIESWLIADVAILILFISSKMFRRRVISSVDTLTNFGDL